MDWARWKGAYRTGVGGGDLYYMRSRWYEPQTGRFLSEDPLGLGGGLNLYAYAGNDPVNGSDPSGLVPWGIGIACRWDSDRCRRRIGGGRRRMGGLEEQRGRTPTGDEHVLRLPGAVRRMAPLGQRPKCLCRRWGPGYAAAAAAADTVGGASPHCRAVLMAIRYMRQATSSPRTGSACQGILLTSGLLYIVFPISAFRCAP